MPLNEGKHEFLARLRVYGGHKWGNCFNLCGDPGSKYDISRGKKNMGVHGAQPLLLEKLLALFLDKRVEN